MHTSYEIAKYVAYLKESDDSSIVLPNYLFSSSESRRDTVTS